MTKHEKRATTTDKIVLEHTPVTPDVHERIAQRLLAAIAEINAALKEAHEDAGMRVFLEVSRAEAEASHFNIQIYRLSHATLTYRVLMKTQEDQAEWRAVKDPAFMDMAGQGFRAIKKKKES